MAAAIKPIREVAGWPETAYVVERRRHISELNGWRKWLLRIYFVWGGRFFYFVLRCPVPDVYGFWKEAQGVSLDFDPQEARKRAEGWLQDESWYFQTYPVNRCLPLETCQFGEQRFSKATGAGLYEMPRSDYVAVERSRLINMDRDAQSVVDVLKT